MFTNRQTLTPRWKVIIRAAVIALVLFFALVAVRLVSGQSLNIRSSLAAFVRPITSPIKATIHHKDVIGYNHGNFDNIIFLHHSVGRNLIDQGQVRERFQEAGYVFWDHDYNKIGLRDPQGNYTGYDYRVPDDNTNPDGLAEIFAQPVHDLPLNTFSGLMQYEIIIIKSCFPVSNITSDAQLSLYQSYYLELRAAMDEHPEKIFIILTQPPLNPARTNPETASRARALATWLVSPEFLDGHPNIYTFDFFDLLAESTPASPDYNMLRRDYREGRNSHPTQAANETIGPLFVDFVINAAQAYRENYTAPPNK